MYAGFDSSYKQSRSVNPRTLILYMYDRVVGLPPCICRNKDFGFFFSRDCVRGVGFVVLHKAFEILSNIEDDELEVNNFSSLSIIYVLKCWDISDSYTSFLLFCFKSEIECKVLNNFQSYMLAYLFLLNELSESRFLKIWFELLIAWRIIYQKQKKFYSIILVN